MAFFQRADERDRLVLCNICEVKCSERSMTAHRSKCAERHADKFTKGLLIRCHYDSGHIVDKGMLDWHYEFCAKRQSQILGEFQQATRFDQVPNLDTAWSPVSYATDKVDDTWNRVADDKNNFIYKMGHMSLKDNK